MSMKKKLEKGVSLVTQLQDIRDAKEEFIEENSDVLGKLDRFSQSEAALMSELASMANDVRYPKGVAVIPIAGDFAFKQTANALYARPGVMEYAEELLNGGVLKPPSAANVEKLIKQGKLPPEASKYVPPGTERTFKSSLAKPRGW